ncbi:MAG TPA: PEP-CTERM sorting domain-containing protein [Blastocatellia bacterium]|nr:PEP-CTERM sorting domain-containing protein [Blastocatellia bacterium]
MWRKFALCILLCGLLTRVIVADPVTYRQIQQDREKQLAGQSATSNRSASQGTQVQQPQPQSQDETPQFVRLPDGRIVPYGPGAVCTENCVEPFEARAPNRTRPWVWGLPLIAGGLIAGLTGGGVIGGGPVGGVSATPTPGPTVPAVTPTPLPSPTPGAEVPEPSTIVLLGIGLTMLLRWHQRRGEEEHRN